MKIHWESRDWPGASIEQTITSLDWIYDQRGPIKEGCGLLSVGCDSGSVGITSTDLGPDHDCCRRYNSNLRGHLVSISQVSWNKVLNKLFSCDINGVIYLWVPNEERWTVELVNDRAFKIRDFKWSPNGLSALMCYDDNFVLIGSATGQRIWANTFAIPVLCGCWAPNSQELVLGFNNGVIHIITDQGVLITEKTLFQEGIQKLEFSPVRNSDGKCTLAVLSASNQILFLNSTYEHELGSWKISVHIKLMRWSNDGSMLAVVCSNNRIVILDSYGHLLHSFFILKTKHPVSAFTWAYDDQMIVIASGGNVFVGKVVREIPLLTDMCRIPSMAKLQELICQPSAWRWFCTIVTMGSKNSIQYKLCVEHMGGFVSILIGRQINRIIPHFIISFPPNLLQNFSENQTLNYECGSTAQVEDVGGEFRRESSQRTSMWRRSKRQIRRFVSRRVTSHLPRTQPSLVQVTSNVWCTRFKVTSTGLANLPNILARVSYKTSVLHLQPRQMSINLCDLSAQNSVEKTKENLGKAENSNILKDNPIHRVPLISQGFPVSICPSSFYPNQIHRTSTHSQTIDTTNLDESPFIISSNTSNRNFWREDTSSPELTQTVNVVPSDYVEQVNSNNNIPGTVLAEEDDEDYTSIAGPSGLNSQTEEISTDEKILYENVLTEFNGLRDAVNIHIVKMKKFASELEYSTKKSVLATKKTSSECGAIGGLNLAKNLPKKSLKLGAATTDSSATNSMAINSDINWQNRLDLLDFIDDDNVEIESDEKTNLLNLPQTSGCAKQRIRSASLSKTTQKPLNNSNEMSNFKRQNQKQLIEIKSVIEKLSKVALDLSTPKAIIPPFLPLWRKEHANNSTMDLDTSTLTNPHLALGNNIVASKAEASIQRQELENDMNIVSLRAQVRDIARQLSHFEERIKINNLLNEIREDLQKRIQHIKTVLGEENDDDDDEENAPENTESELDDGEIDLLRVEETQFLDNEDPKQNLIDSSTIGKKKPKKAKHLRSGDKKEMKEKDKSIKMLHMTNKTPFWNEQSQVYQLDFNGRVTQESAKNFQIDFQSRQVLQFGRIENGAYTLDFKEPFSAIQAFAIALAGITQRLK